MIDRLTWLGHATAVIELDGAVVITDPLLRRRVGHLRRCAPAQEVPARVDLVLVSHLHRDHLDLPSVRLLDPAAPVVVPRGAARVLRRARRDVHELSAGESLDIAGVQVHAVPAVHDGRRSPLSRRAAEAVGYVVEARRRAYFAGDTALFAAMAELPEVDAALVPISGWGTGLGPGHMDPDEAAAAVALIRPRLVVPIHWGTFAPIGAGGRGDRTPALRFAARVAERAPGVTVRLLAPGETVAL